MYIYSNASRQRFVYFIKMQKKNSFAIIVELVVVPLVNSRASHLLHLTSIYISNTDKIKRIAYNNKDVLNTFIKNTEFTILMQVANAVYIIKQCKKLWFAIIVEFVVVPLVNSRTIHL